MIITGVKAHPRGFMEFTYGKNGPTLGYDDGKGRYRDADGNLVSLYDLYDSLIPDDLEGLVRSHCAEHRYRTARGYAHMMPLHMRDTWVTYANNAQMEYEFDYAILHGSPNQVALALDVRKTFMKDCSPQAFLLVAQEKRAKAILDGLMGRQGSITTYARIINHESTHYKSFEEWKKTLT